ncbi:hypothetical protein [Nocardia carnea]|uniref:hypothetical protein n=1 Tax=Nocardia carnea TaxID=37328 RepID=UPI002455FB26|nr:hypothetical protein [Nocardia carnea]
MNWAARDLHMLRRVHAGFTGDSRISGVRRDFAAAITWLWAAPLEEVRCGN